MGVKASSRVASYTDEPIPEVSSGGQIAGKAGKTNRGGKVYLRAEPTLKPLPPLPLDMKGIEGSKTFGDTVAWNPSESGPPVPPPKNPVSMFRYKATASNDADSSARVSMRTENYRATLRLNAFKVPSDEPGEEDHQGYDAYANDLANKAGVAYPAARPAVPVNPADIAAVPQGGQSDDDEGINRVEDLERRVFVRRSSSSNASSLGERLNNLLTWISKFLPKMPVFPWTTKEFVIKPGEWKKAPPKEAKEKLMSTAIAATKSEEAGSSKVLDSGGADPIVRRKEAEAGREPEEKMTAEQLNQYVNDEINSGRKGGPLKLGEDDLNYLFEKPSETPSETQKLYDLMFPKSSNTTVGKMERYNLKMKARFFGEVRPSQIQAKENRIKAEKARKEAENQLNELI